MTEDRFDELMRDAGRTYRNPPEPDFDAMWQSIEHQHFNAAAHRDGAGAAKRPSLQLLTNRWIAIAATLVIGIGIGRASMSVGTVIRADIDPTASVATAEPASRADTSLGRPYELETSRYLGQTAALLVSLPSEVRSGGANPQFALRAADLLSRTRLLIDSPAATDPAMRALLEDLELVLMQVVRLHGSNSAVDLDLINRALEQRDVIPRLRTAAAENSAN